MAYSKCQNYSKSTFEIAALKDTVMYIIFDYNIYTFYFYLCFILLMFWGS